ncbi:TcpE family conjugal transfer membrane protein [Metamycoplasma hominis]|uniref:TcpE family conjugal transfer membrane protein n=1 Tax=Metamycoplasma hominis TaxID=2098 RepID=UPI004037968A
MKKIRSYTSIWSVEKVLYSINDFRLPFPITFTQMTWFVVSLFAVMILGNLPPSFHDRGSISQILWDSCGFHMVYVYKNFWW